MLAIDIYVNETTRHADVILPGPGAAREVALRPGALPAGRAQRGQLLAARVRADRGRPEWEIFLRLAGVVAGQGPDADVDALDDLVVATLVQREVGDAGSASPAASRPRCSRRSSRAAGPSACSTSCCAPGPTATASAHEPDGLTLDELERNPHGVDLGPHRERMPEVLRTPSGKIELAPEAIVADVARLRGALARERNGGLVLIGRRQLRSNNSWMHNLPALVKGKDRCTLHVHPDDAERLGLADGGRAWSAPRAGQIEAPVEVTDAIMPGVVSIPHGWGHDAPGVRMRVACEHAGVNSNVLADESLVDPLSGNAVLNGIPVEVRAAVTEPVPATFRSATA